jgi:hypothetical protein
MVAGDGTLTERVAQLKDRSSALDTSQSELAEKQVRTKAKKQALGA